MIQRAPVVVLALSNLVVTPADLSAQGGPQFMATVADREQPSVVWIDSMRHELARGTYEAVASGFPAPTQVRIFWDGYNHAATVNLPAGFTAHDFKLGDFDSDGRLDLVVMSADASGTGSGSLFFYLDVLGDQTLDHTVNSLGPGVHSFAVGSLETVQAFPGGPDRVLVADPGYTVGGLAQVGLLVSVDLFSGPPTINWGWQGTYSQAQFGAALAARDATPTVGGAVIFSELGHQGAQGDEGRVWAANPVDGTLWWAVDGLPGSKLGTEATFNGHWAMVSNPDANHVALGESGNGAVLHIDLRNVTGIVDFGAQGERLGMDLKPFGDTHVAVASERQFDLFPLGSGSSDYFYLPRIPASTSVSRSALTVRHVPGFDDPVVTYQTESPLPGGGVEYRAADVTTEVTLRSDIYEIHMPQPNAINLLIDQPSMPNALAFLAVSIDTNPGALTIPGLASVLTLTPPIFGLAVTNLDPTGFGIHTEPWPGANGWNEMEVLFSGALFPAPGSSNSPEFMNYVAIQFRY